MKVLAEQWRPVVGYEGLYEVSERGRVRSLDRVVIDGRIFRGRIVNAERVRYVRVHLRKNGQRTRVGVHQLVLAAFVGPASVGAQGCHRDGNPMNNTPSNLYWGTAAENAHDRVRHHTDRNATKERCPRGHALVEPNLMPSSLKRGQRECLACNRAGSYARNVLGERKPSQRLTDDYFAQIMSVQT